ncbi:hypothetical protein EXU48_08360 [Occultella glacieicola]|uniref:Small multidrug efflux protein n=1 Tax=Occultella glacieicola TaxID=2518684 RepID=A0ABY2E4I6_9MICO|nr:hypothetical protein [Occultella glacieicola]TDE94801.1 hypothetical protein EXU48_08360 [Occultella glacieicola]
MSDLLIDLQAFTESLPPLLRWVGVLLAGLIPYVEAEGASVIGIVAGIHPAIAIPAAVIGNAIALLVVVSVTSAVRSGVKAAAGAASSAGSARSRTAAGSTGAVDTIDTTATAVDESNPKRQRMRRVFDRWGVPGVSFLGPLLLPSHVTAAAMVGFGAPKARVFVWGVVAVAAWAVVIGVLVYLGVQVALH